MSGGLVEIRDYTIEPEWFDAYRDWARDHAAPWLKANLDVIDFWVDDGQEALVSAIGVASHLRSQKAASRIPRRSAAVAGRTLERAEASAAACSAMASS